jgi:uncharacterized Zn-binding protein involved in type VI secretion
MGQPAAKSGDKVIAMDNHIVLVPAAAGAPVPTPTPFEFNGTIQIGLSSNVQIMGSPAATVNSIAVNSPMHIPKSGSFKSPPSNQGTISSGSSTVNINGQAAARNGDRADTCNDPGGPSTPGMVVASGTVLIG